VRKVPRGRDDDAEKAVAGACAAGLLVGARPADLMSTDNEESSRLWVISWLRDPERESDRLIGFRSNTFGGAVGRCGDEFGVSLTTLSRPEPSDESVEEEAE
jgi:hypothetical protein